jgi:RHS repeat-associated protein
MSAPAAGGVAVGHPVDVASGVLSNTYRDARVMGRPPIDFVRSYSSALADRDGVLGPGWYHGFDLRLGATIDGHRLLDAGGGSVDFIDGDEALARGDRVRHLGAFAEIGRVDGGFVVTRWSADSTGVSRLVFPHVSLGQWARPTVIQDARGDRLHLTWDARGLLGAIEQRRSGRRLELSYRSDRLTQVTAVAGGGRRTLASYGYDGRSRLESYTDAGGNTARYRYDDAGRLVEEMARDGSIWSFTFNAAGRCVRATGRDGYDEKRLAYDVAARTTRVTDSRDAVWTYFWNEAGQVVRAESPLGRVTQSVFDEHGRLAKSIDAGGGATSFEYDEAGNRCAIQDPKGLVTSFVHDADHQLIQLTDKGGHVWRRGHDASGRLIEMIDPAGSTFRMTWSPEGDLTRLEGPAGLVRRYFWTPAGELSALAGASENAFHYQYDEWGHLVASQDPLGNVTRRRRDARGLLIAVDWPDGTVTRNEYTPSGELTRTIDRDGTVMTYRISSCSTRWGAVERANRTFRFTWENEPSLLTQIQNPNGETRTFEYDDDLRVTRAVGFDGIETTYTYDAAGRLVGRTVGGERTTFEHDELGAIVKGTYADGSVVEMTYDDLGRLAEIKDPASSVRFERDPLGHPTLEQAGEFQVERTFDPLGRLIARRTSLGFETTRTLNDAGRPVAMTIGGARLELEYDAVGREIARRFDGGATLRSAWNPMHRLVEQEVTTAAPRGGASGTATTALDPPIHRRYTYDPGDKLRVIDDDRWGRGAYAYDEAGRLTGADLAAGASERYVYDAAGNVVETANRLGADPTASWSTTRRRLAPGGQLTAEGALGFRYDSVGRLTEMSAGAGGPTWTYRWDARGRLIEAQLPDGATHRFGYDALDRRTWKEGPGGRTEYRWDGDRMTHQIAPDGRVQSWELTVGTLTPVAKQEDGQVHFAVTDHLGTPRELLTGDGRITWSAVLSPRGNVVRFGERATDCALRFAGQWWDDETSLSYNRFRYYSPSRGQFLSRDPLAKLLDFNAYAYPNNPLEWIDPFGLLAEVFYPQPDALGRPQGATALVTPADAGTGTDANPAIRPPGFEGGGHPAHHERGHLIPNRLGGDGNDPRNLVTVTGGSNHPGMANVEARIAAHVEAGNYVEMKVTPIYEGDNLVPSKIRIQATDLATGQVVADEEIQNGLHKNYRGCSH